jgi:hypothetical protein
MNEPIEITQDAVLGTWHLVRTYETLDGVETGKAPIGEGAYGVIHYLPDDRMAVVMAHADHVQLSAGRYNSGEEETAASARTFTAYAGSYTCHPDRIVHHLDVCLYENDNGTDYVRFAEIHGDRLTLSMPPVPTGKGEMAWHLEWQKLAPQP